MSTCGILQFKLYMSRMSTKIKWFTCIRFHLQTYNLPLPNRLVVKILNCIQKKDDFHRKLACVCVLLRLAGECFANIETSPLLVKFWIIWGFWPLRAEGTLSCQAAVICSRGYCGLIQRTEPITTNITGIQNCVPTGQISSISLLAV